MGENEIMNRKFIVVSFCLIIVFTILMVGCKEQDNKTKSDEGIVVAVSIVPLEGFVNKIAGDFVDVVTMIPPGFSPENYQPTIQQMTKLSDSKVYFSIGVQADETSIVPKLKTYNKNIELVPLDKEVSKVYKDRFFDEEDNEEHHEHTGRDPHIWMSPKRSIVMINKIKEELIKIDSKNKLIYEKNANNFIKELEDIDEEIKDTLKNKEKQTFIIFHPSMGYFADDYNLNMLAIEESGKNATVKRLQNVIDIAREKDIKVILYQEEFDSSQAETIAKEINGRTIEIAPLDISYIESLKSILRAFKEVL